ncbi:right-handed parallel beta-helix repeat-containing protein [Promineifilum sp.]|uniref:right-handed parallel beta-helix repeat-containing protein n=1 Tax=Promineifilum sp. TaxID=2664178 RepID=UPI0035B038CC
MKSHTGKPIIVLTLLLLLLLAGNALAQSPASQNTFYAPAVLSPTACTTVVNAGQSIQAAVNAARSGQTVCVRGGIYVEQVQLKPSSAGISLMAYPGEHPVIDGQNRVPAVTTQNKFAGLIHITGSNIIVDGFEVRNGTMRGIVVGQPASATPIQNVIVRNTFVHTNKEAGIVVTGSSTTYARNVLIENNVVYNNLRKNAGGAAGGSALAFVQTTNSIARGNRVYNNYGEGLVADRWSSGIVLEDNTTYDNRGANLYLINTTNPLVRRNLVYCTDDRTFWRKGKATAYRAGPGLQVRDEDFEGQSVKPPPSSGQVIINNVVIGCGSNFGVATQIAGGGLNNALIANNSFINARSDTGEGANNIEIEGRSSLRNTRFVNNLIVQTVPGTITRIQTTVATPNMSTFTVANNLYNKAPSNGWFSTEAGRVIGDPLLGSLALPVRGVLPNVAGFAIRVGSPAIDRGQAVSHVTDDFFKGSRAGALDIGADELGGGTGYIIQAPVAGEAEAIAAAGAQPAPVETALPATLHVSPTATGTLGDVAYNPGDILAYDTATGAWSVVFNAAAAGLNKPLSDFELLPDGSILLAVDGRARLQTPSGRLTLTAHDVARYVPDGAAGRFELYFDGSDAGLTRPSERIDALALRPDGALLISTAGPVAVGRGAEALRAEGSALLAFQPATLGADTAGAWSLALDGAALYEGDVTTAWYDADGALYAGDDEAIFAIGADGSASLYWSATDAADMGLKGFAIGR